MKYILAWALGVPGVPYHRLVPFKPSLGHPISHSHRYILSARGSPRERKLSLKTARPKVTRKEHTMADKKTLKDLLADEIKDLYSAEKQLTKAIPKDGERFEQPGSSSGFDGAILRKPGNKSNASKKLAVCSASSRRARNASEWRASSRKARRHWPKKAPTTCSILESSEPGAVWSTTK